MMVMIYIDHFSKIVQMVPLQESDARSMAGMFLSMVVSIDFQSVLQVTIILTFVVASRKR